jgi:manganese/zinc/iron transport system permease protein
MSMPLDFFTDYTLRTVAAGSALLGLVAGSLGTFAVLRRQSLLGDAVSHAALPGIVLAFMLTGSKAPLVLVLGAALAGWAASLLVMLVVRTTRIKMDTALGLMLSTFFGLGLVLMSVIQRTAGEGMAGLEHFLFGQAATLVGEDLQTMGGLGVLVLLGLVLLWKEFKLLSFDPAFAGAAGLPVRGLNIILTTLLVIAIVIGLQAVGVVLMSAMIVTPAAAARQWTNRLGVLVVLAGLFGALSGLAGAVASSLVPRLPTGPAIIMAMTVITVVSLLVAPGRGLLATYLRRQKQRRSVQSDTILADLFRLADQHDDPIAAPHEVPALVAMRAGTAVDRGLNRLRDRGLVVQDPDGRWRLTASGAERGRDLVQGDSPLADPPEQGGTS